MRRKAAVLFLLLGSVTTLPAAEIQGVIADWNCVKPMVKDGRAKVLQRNRSCSLMKNYTRDAYGLITDDQKFYRLDDPGNQRILELLKNSPGKDTLKVVVKGDLQGNTLKIDTISML